MTKMVGKSTDTDLKKKLLFFTPPENMGLIYVCATQVPREGLHNYFPLLPKFTQLCACSIDNLLTQEVACYKIRQVIDMTSLRGHKQNP